jgi:hypothetical protein
MGHIQGDLHEVAGVYLSVGDELRLACRQIWVALAFEHAALPLVEFRSMADDTSIKVSRQTRERLTQLAGERRMTLKDVVEELAAATPTVAELAEREERAREVLAAHFGVEVTDVELAASARLRALISGRKAVA